MTYKSNELQAFENLINDTLVTFATEHGPLIRKTFKVHSADVPIAPLVESAFMGRCAALLAARFGRENLMAMVTTTLDQAEAGELTAEKAAERFNAEERKVS